MSNDVIQAAFLLLGTLINVSIYTVRGQELSGEKVVGERLVGGQNKSYDHVIFYYQYQV